MPDQTRATGGRTPRSTNKQRPASGAIEDPKGVVETRSNATALPFKGFKRVGDVLRVDAAHADHDRLHYPSGILERTTIRRKDANRLAVFARRFVRTRFLLSERT